MIQRVIAFLFCMMMSLLWYYHPHIDIDDQIALTFIWGIASLVCLMFPITKMEEGL